MDEAVNGLLQNWKISDAEDFNVVKVEDVEQLMAKRFWLVGKLLNSKPFNKDSLKYTMKKIWRTREPVTVTDWKGGERFLFSFRTEHDRNMVMRGSPWSFDNALLLLSPTDGNEDPSVVPVDTQNFWILVRGLPPCLLTKAMGTRIGNIIGKYVEFDFNRNGGCTGSFLRVRIKLEIAKPLKRWVRLDLGKGEECFQLDYESLPHFCLYCGRLSHLGSNCTWRKEGVITEPQYGRWKTLSKSVFNINPNGQLQGVSFGLTSNKPPWKMLT